GSSSSGRRASARWPGPRRLFLSAGTVLVRADDGGVEHHELVVSLARQGLEHPCKHAAFTPSPVAPVGGLPVPVPLRQITPGNAGAIAVDDGIDEQPVVGRRPADVTFAAGQEVLDLVPLVVAERIAMHVSASRLPTPDQSEAM